jgi:hypothetical protein
MSVRVLSGLCLISIVLLSAACNSVRDASDTGSENSPTPISTTESSTDIAQEPTLRNTPEGSSGFVTVPNLDRMLLYPGAMNVVVESDNTFPATSKTFFETWDNAQKVWDFYASELPKQGWTCDEDPGGSPCNEFIWTSTDPEIGYKLHVWVSHEVLIGGETRVGLFTRRWPDVDKIPLVPNAQDVRLIYMNDSGTQTVETAEVIFNSDWERVTSYWVAAKPEEIEDFYKANLLLPDWETIEGATSVSSTEGLGFRYMRDVARVTHEEYRGGRVLITAGPTADGYTKVEVNVRGYDVAPSNGE